MLRLLVACLLVLPLCGCALVPQVSRQPVVQNPFPQLAKVAVAPFINLSAEPSVDGRQFALAYYNELQSVPGFEVVPVGTVEQAMRAHNINLRGAEESRRLADILGVDAVVVGAVTDFTPYYPPRCAMHIEWYAANPFFHEVPPGYGLPFGTPEEEQIPGPLVFQAEFALARAQMEQHTPPYAPQPVAPGMPHGLQLLPLGESPPPEAGLSPTAHASRSEQMGPASGGDCAVPSGNLAGQGELVPHNGPVLKHTQAYNGHDAEITAALASYYEFRDDARFGGWQSYLQRSDDFIRFCCHMHIAEMLTARGGAGETRVVWRWPTGR